MTYKEVVSILGKPEPKRYSGEEDRIDEATGRRRCTWLAMDLGTALELYTVTFDPEGRADFVPYVKSRKRDPGTGIIYVTLVRTPGDRRGE